jgi:hypothetical protein
MKREEANELVLRSLTEDISVKDRELIESELLVDSSFSYGFVDRVINRIETLKRPSFFRPEFIRSMDIGFRRVALTGVAAILVLTLSILLNQGSLSYDTLLGIDNMVDDSLVSLLIE